MNEEEEWEKRVRLDSPNVVSRKPDLQPIVTEHQEAEG